MSAATLERIRQRLVGLKMPFALEHLDLLVRQLEAGELNALEAIEALLSEELLIRENRRIKMGLNTARLMPPKTLESFDFAFQPSLEKPRIDALASLGFIERKEVVHFLGPPGTGKSHLACALGGDRYQGRQKCLPNHTGRPGRQPGQGPPRRTTEPETAPDEPTRTAHRR